VQDAVGLQRQQLMADMQARGGMRHFFGDHPNKQLSPYPMFRRAFQSLVKPLAKRGIPVINCTRASALECFPKADLHATLPRAA
jgi:hypothetical protein